MDNKLHLPEVARSTILLTIAVEVLMHVVLCMHALSWLANTGLFNGIGIVGFLVLFFTVFLVMGFVAQCLTAFIYAFVIVATEDRGGH